MRVFNVNGRNRARGGVGSHSARHVGRRGQMYSLNDGSANAAWLNIGSVVNTGSVYRPFNESPFSV